MVKETKPTNPALIREEIDPAHMIDAVMNNYKDAQSAFMELVDNAVDNRIPGKPLTITIRTRGNSLFIGNMGGKGLDLPGLQKFFTWGFSDKRELDDQIGRYGQGGKAAMGYLGDSMQVVCSDEGSDIAYKVEDPNWRVREQGKLKEFTPQEHKAVSTEGYFNVTISNFRRRLDEKALARRLGKVYMPLLRGEDGTEPQVKIILNKQVVEPMKIDYLESDPELVPQSYLLQNRLGLSSPITVGVLESEGEAGIYCYKHGRLISEGKFFGIPSDIPGRSRMSGEVHLDFVPVTANKSDFDEDSEEWKAAAKSIEGLLRKHWVEKLKSVKTEKVHQPSKEELQLAKRLKSEFEDFLHHTGFFTKEDVPGSSTGRIPAQNPGEPRPDPKGGTHASPEGQTPPRGDAVEGKGKVRRWGPFDDWEVGSLGTTKKRGAILVEDGKHVLRVNTDYLAYQKALQSGLNALDLYYIDTIAIEIGKMMKSDSVEEYYDFINELVRSFTEFREHKKQISHGEIFNSKK